MNLSQCHEWSLTLKKKINVELILLFLKRDEIVNFYSEIKCHLVLLLVTPLTKTRGK